MKVVGEQSDDWHPEFWLDYGISMEDAKVILDEYSKKYPEDSHDTL